MAPRLAVVLLVACVVGANASAATACGVSPALCSVAPKPSHAPLLHCGSRGAIVVNQTAVLGPACKASSVEDCASSCFSMKGCRSFRYSDQNKCTLFAETIDKQNFKRNPASKQSFYNHRCFVYQKCPTSSSMTHPPASSSSPSSPTPTVGNFNIQAVGAPVDGLLLQAEDDGTNTGYYTGFNVNNDPLAGLPNEAVQNYTLDPISGYVMTTDGLDRLYATVLDNPPILPDLFIIQDDLNPTSSNVIYYPLVCQVTDPVTLALSCGVPSYNSTYTQFTVYQGFRDGTSYKFLISVPGATRHTPVNAKVVEILP